MPPLCYNVCIYARVCINYYLEYDMGNFLNSFSNALKKTTDKIILCRPFKPYTSAIITVGGSGTRMQNTDGKTKQFMEVCGLPVITRTLLEFQSSPYIDEIIIVSKEDEISLYTEMISNYSLTKVKQIAKGGKTRQDSVLNGFKVISPKADYVCIHDGVRCLITQENIRNVLREAFASGAACAASKIYDTLKMADSSMFIEFTPDRSRAYSAQTPQVFKSDIYRACAYSAKKDGFIATDDCMLAEHYGFKVKLVDCGRNNLKITTNDDLILAEAIINNRENRGMKEMKIGHGYDVHKLVEGRKLILGGVEIPHDKGLDGHSDADVLIHAIMDSVIGALGLGDIGLHFPDNDKKYKNIDSFVLAKRTAELLKEKGYKISNIDATLIMQAPKVRPYIEQMQKNIAQVYSVDVSCVNVKATTEEGLGFTGEKLGISAHSVCLITKL